LTTYYRAKNWWSRVSAYPMFTRLSISVIVIIKKK
jgi:hypothetical protein